MLGPAVTALRDAIDVVQAAVRDLEAEPVPWSETRDELVALDRERERLEHAIGSLASDCAARRAHERDSARSMADLLTAQTGQRRQVTGSRMTLATKLRSMPLTDDSVADGRITHCHAHVLSRALNPRTTEAFARDEHLLVGAAEKLTADELARVVEMWLRYADPDGSAPDPEGPADTFHLSQTLDGRLKGTFDLGGQAAILAKAIIDEVTEQLRRRDAKARAADPTDPRIDQPTSQRRARALTEILDRAAASPANPARRLPLLNIHTTLQTLTRTGEPTDWKIDLEEAWRSAIPHRLLDLWACDCFAGRIVLDAHGLPLDVGRAERLATPAQKRAVIARDGTTCPVPGCDAPVAWSRFHHIHHWTADGPTREQNLVAPCHWHHQRIHDGHLIVYMTNGRPQFSLPDGTTLHEPRAGPHTDTG